MNLSDALSEHRNGDSTKLIGAIPHARFLGIACKVEGGHLVTSLPFRAALVGNPTLPALHGGVVASVLELTAALHLLWLGERPTYPKTITHSVDYLRSAGPETLHARAIIRRQGRRVVNVETQAWQRDPNELVAVAHGHFLFLAGTER